MLLARSPQRDDPLRLRDAPHAFTRTVVFDAQVDGFGVARILGSRLAGLLPKQFSLGTIFGLPEG